MSDRPLILITNDDGVNAPGLSTLRAAAMPLGDVVVVAPTHEQSGSSHSITLNRPLRHIDHGHGVHSIDGTPADCVYLALFEPRFLGRRPDLVLAGINHGANMGTSVFYSGTVAGAREAALRDISAIAFSHDGGSAEDPWLVEVARGLTERFLQSEKPEGRAILLNINIPREPPRGVRVTRVGRHIYEEEVIPRRDPRQREYFWISGRIIDYGDVEGSDRKAVDEGYVSVTPLALEPTLADHLGVAAFVAGPRPDTEEPRGENP